MLRLQPAFALVSLLAVTIGVPRAANAAHCDKALILSTFNSFSSDHVDWRLAALVTKDEYDEITRDAGGHAVIYGIPVGASYDEFQNHISQFKSSHQESLTHDQVRNILWTGLDPTAKDAYSDCLNAEVKSARGLHLAVVTATKNDVSVLVSYSPQGDDPPEISPRWTWKGTGRDQLPQNVRQGQSIALLPRPASERTLVVNYRGIADSIILTPLERIQDLPQKAQSHKEDKDGHPYVTYWQMDPACSHKDRLDAAHRCYLDRAQIHEPGDNTPFDVWNLWVDVPGNVYEVTCEPTGSNEIKAVGKPQGHTGLCTGEINGNDADIRMSVKWEQIW